MKINIPLKLVSNANSHSHWTKSHKRAKTQKALVTYYLKSFGTEKPTHFPIYVTLTRFAPRPFDDDNLQSAFKYIRDAVSEYVTGCTIPGRADGDSRIKWNYCQEKTVDKHYFISIQIDQVNTLTPSSPSNSQSPAADPSQASAIP